MTKTRVLIVDDSGFARSILSKGLAMAPGIDVVGSAGDPIEAQQQIKKLKPDVMTLDVHMPKMNGIEFLQKLMPENPLPVVMVSAYTEKSSKITIDALMAGAVDFVLKPANGTYEELSDMITEIQEKIKAAAHVDVRKKLREKVFQMNGKVKIAHNIPLENKIIVIGASTGGVDAIWQIVKQLPPFCPGIVVVQHMPVEFTRMFAERLNSLCSIDVKEAKNGDTVFRGRALIAPGNTHMLLHRSGARYYVEIKDGPLVNRHRPSVDVLFRSTAKYAGNNAIGVLMTGMGDDGASGLLEMKEAGAYTIAQDEQSCVVYGMPKEAIKRGAACAILALNNMAGYIMKNHDN